MTGPYLFKEGSWFILNKEQAGPDMHTYPHESLIWHECQADPKPPGYSGCWRVGTRFGLGASWRGCGACGEVCPSGLQGLWTLHNWETMDRLWIQETSFYQSIP